MATPDRPVHPYRIGEAASMLGVSADTMRRWVDAGRLPATRDENGHRIIAGAELAAFARELARPENSEAEGRSSARNRFPGIVTAVVLGDVAAQVEIQAGPFRVVSLISRDSAEELGLVPGAPATAVIKSTNVVVERR
ncbi:TOBE domain-containing protein [Kitasatospora cheerisanensis]|uniref:MerR family transcriptional regulator n=1 Tax=Kitasatospora cheerisanensis KCTC 2395 TaxID=1348663 RepID=A0A066YI96_9ACTN|nr:helix-turn-helix transcriptional regulator [Kitasatospora cheerisanensis]KDN80887.1 MerR family transcriptional regulator [Kitasatospora cheerisanensis KCTC 2395]